MADTATKTRSRDYWVLDVWAPGIGKRRIITQSQDEALNLAGRWVVAFGPTAEESDWSISHVRSLR